MTDTMDLDAYRATLRTPRRSEEADAQVALFDLLGRLEGRWPLLAFVHHSANESSGANKVRRSYTKRDGTQGYKMVPIDVMRDARMGTKKGFPDIIVPVQRYEPSLNVWYVGLIVERKIAGEKPSEAQERWLTHFRAQGWCCVVNAGDWRPAARLIIDWCGGDASQVEGL